MVWEQGNGTMWDTVQTRFMQDVDGIVSESQRVFVFELMYEIVYSIEEPSTPLDMKKGSCEIKKEYPNNLLFSLFTI